jgi:glycosyltransferase involved in cell wall biosynthesis
MKKLQVAIPFCHTSNCLQLNTAIQSVLNQTLCPDKILLIQDGPVHSELVNLVKEFCEQYPIVRALIIPVNKGLPNALNSSIDFRFEYYARMDADDICHSQRLEKQVNFLDENKGIDILGTWAIEFISDNLNNGFLKKMPQSEKEIRRIFHFRDPFIHPSVMFRTSVFEKIGCYNNKYYTNQDTELWARALKKKVGVANLQEPLLSFRADNVANKRSDFKRIILELQARYTFNTFSPVLNLLKIASILFRFAPFQIRKLAYKNFR